MKNNFTIYDREKQITKWLTVNFDTPFPVKVVWVKDLINKEIKNKRDQSYYAETYLENKVIIIKLNKRLCSRSYCIMIDTLLHEYAHAVDWRHYSIEKNKREPHGVEWGIYYAQIYSAYNDNGGWKESKKY